MKAIVVRPGDQEPQLVWTEAPDPLMGAGEVLVRVRATAVNRADLSQARGLYPPPPGVTDILGLEMAGVVEAVGAAVPDRQVGDRVCALLPGGGYAELVAVPHELLMPIPAEWGFDRAAAVPEAWLTAFVNLFREGGLQHGETVLIHAAASGVGTAAIQLARESGAQVIAVVGSTAKAQACLDLGAATAIDYHQQDFRAAVMSATANRGVDLILDPVGGSNLKNNIATLAEHGRLVNIGLLGGTQGELDMGLVLRRSLRIVGSRLRPRPLAEKIAITREFSHRFRPGLIAGRLRPIIDRSFPIAEAGAAHRYVAENRNIGKVLLVVREEA